MKRIMTILGALMVCVALGSAARAQTPAQTTKYNRYLSNHPGAGGASTFRTNPVMGNVSDYMTSNGGMQNRYTAAAQAKYQKNLQRYNYYLATHPGMANASPYAGGYPGMQNYGAYAPTQQPAGNPLMATLAPFLGNYSGMQNSGGYSGGMPMQQPYATQPSYVGSGYGPSSGGYGNPAFGRWAMEQARANRHLRQEAAMAMAAQSQGGRPWMFGSRNNVSGRGMMPGFMGASVGTGGWGSRAFAAARHQRWARNH